MSSEIDRNTKRKKTTALEINPNRNREPIFTEKTSPFPPRTPNKKAKTRNAIENIIPLINKQNNHHEQPANTKKTTKTSPKRANVTQQLKNHKKITLTQPAISSKITTKSPRRKRIKTPPTETSSEKTKLNQTTITTQDENYEELIDRTYTLDEALDILKEQQQSSPNPPLQTTKTTTLKSSHPQSINHKTKITIHQSTAYKITHKNIQQVDICQDN
ncbi:hypothetical protein CHS0354_015637 [Potamilus streckersoni]|uniref:Uncharacterized protein n=1 Tax=Potamilus streckersoni TaxID=2493646 RepID=A0AAE0SFM5_9BIVA|nr:hypothetical protein CHS0354_015637 [Potamilus streckersoni]